MCKQSLQYFYQGILPSDEWQMLWFQNYVSEQTEIFIKVIAIRSYYLTKFEISVAVVLKPLK